MYRERERQTAAKSNALKKQTLATRALAALARGYPRAHSQTFSPKLHFQKGVMKIKNEKQKRNSGGAPAAKQTITLRKSSKISKIGIKMHSGRFRHRPAMFWKAGNVLHVAIMLMNSEVKRRSHRDAQSHRDAHSRAPRRPPPDSSCYTPVSNCCVRLGPGTMRGALDERFKKHHGCSVVDHVSAVTMR